MATTHSSGTEKKTRLAPTRRTSVARAASTALLGGALMAIFSLATPAGPSGAANLPHVNAAASWTVYHGDPLGSGADTSGVTFSPAHGAWTSPALDGQLYGEPLEATGRVYAATENDTVYALAADS